MSEPRTAQAYWLIADFALGVDGKPQGLTPSELRRAWLARHGDELKRGVSTRLSEQLLVRVLPRRVCAVTGLRVHPYVPDGLERASW